MILELENHLHTGHKSYSRQQSDPSSFPYQFSFLTQVMGTNAAQEDHGKMQREIEGILKKFEQFEHHDETKYSGR